MNRRLIGVIIVILLVVMCVLIAWGQWYAVHVNVPKYGAHRASPERG